MKLRNCGYLRWTRRGAAKKNSIDISSGLNDQVKSSSSFSFEIHLLNNNHIFFLLSSFFTLASFEVRDKHLKSHFFHLWTSFSSSHILCSSLGKRCRPITTNRLFRKIIQFFLLSFQKGSIWLTLDYAMTWLWSSSRLTVHISTETTKTKFLQDASMCERVTWKQNVWACERVCEKHVCKGENACVNVCVLVWWVWEGWGGRERAEEGNACTNTCVR